MNAANPQSENSSGTPLPDSYAYAFGGSGHIPRAGKPPNSRPNRSFPERKPLSRMAGAIRISYAFLDSSWNPYAEHENFRESQPISSWMAGHACLLSLRACSDNVDSHCQRPPESLCAYSAGWRPQNRQRNCMERDSVHAFLGGEDFRCFATHRNCSLRRLLPERWLSLIPWLPSPLRRRK